MLLLLGALLGWLQPASRIDWQPALALGQPWRAFSAAFVHYSRLHLFANLAGLLLIGALGVAAQLPARAAVAWALAWPATQLGLLAQPALAHYGGLSGVLHAGVAVAALQMLLGDLVAQRRLGAIILAVLLAKIVNEAPWAATVTHPPGWDIAVAPGAHLSGSVAGLLAGFAVHGLHLATRRTWPGA